MKCLFIIIFTAGSFLLPNLKLYSFDGSNSIKNFISRNIYSTNTNDDWIVSIDGVYIGRNEFEEGYRYFQSQIPQDQRSKLPGDSEMRKMYLNNMIYQDLVVMQALNDGKVWTPGFDLVLKRMLYQAVYQLYLSEIIPREAVTPTETEINEFYKNNSNSLLMYSDQMKREYAVKTLSEQKIKQWIYNRVESYKTKRIITNRLD